mmetsp:Transcript_90693/g.280485  ORF Transcript_90693/g.280485 Transcript_90693/m.280485 type:complete len:277 (-) Transcript_90693:122-952(-)
MNICLRPSDVTPSRHVESTEVSKLLEEGADSPGPVTGCSMRRVTAGWPRMPQVAPELAMSLSTFCQRRGRTTVARRTDFPRRSSTSTVEDEVGSWTSRPFRGVGGGGSGGSGCTARTHSLPRGTTRPGHSCGQKRFGLAMGCGADGATGSGLEGTGVPMYWTEPMMDVDGVPMKCFSGGVPTASGDAGRETPVCDADIAPACRRVGMGLVGLVELAGIRDGPPSTPFMVSCEGGAGALRGLELREVLYVSRRPTRARAMQTTRKPVTERMVQTMLT